MSINVQPATSSMSSTSSQDCSSRMTSDTQSRTSTTSGTMTSSASAVSSGLPSGITPGIPPCPPQNTMSSGTTLRSQSWPVTHKSETSSLKARSEPRRMEAALLPICACVLVLLVVLILVSLMLSAAYPAYRHVHAETPELLDASKRTQKPNLTPRPPSPAVGHVAAPCNDSTPCLGEAHCVEGVCRCQGIGLRVVKGVCVSVTTPATKTPRSSKTSTTSRRSSTKTLPPEIRFSIVRTVRLRTTSTTTESETEFVSVGRNTTQMVGSARHEEDSRGNTASNVTAQREEDEAVEKRDARPE